LKDKDIRDILGGFGLAAIGVFAVVYGQRYEFGDLNRMGPGYFPVALGALLAVLGVLIALPAFFRRGEPITVAWKTFALVMASIVNCHKGDGVFTQVCHFAYTSRTGAGCG